MLACDCCFHWVVQYLPALHCTSVRSVDSPLLPLAAVGNLLPVKSFPAPCRRETSNRRNPIFQPEREAFHRCPAELEGAAREAGGGGGARGGYFWKGKRERSGGREASLL